MEGGQCRIASSNQKDGLMDAPAGLVERLNMLSAQLKTLLIGKVWHKPLLADNKGMASYIKAIEKAQKESGIVIKHAIEKVM